MTRLAVVSMSAGIGGLKLSALCLWVAKTFVAVGAHHILVRRIKCETGTSVKLFAECRLGTVEGSMGRRVAMLTRLLPRAPE